MSDDKKGGAVRANPTTQEQPPPAQPPPAPEEKKPETLAEKQERERRAAVAEYEKDREAGALDTGYVVADGGSVTSKIGIIGAGQPVAPKHFFNGQTDFEALFERGLIKKAPKTS